MDSSMEWNEMEHNSQKNVTESSVSTQSITNSTPKSQTPKNNSDEHTQLMTKEQLRKLIKQVDPYEQLDDQIQEFLIQMADDFVETSMNAAAELAKHRRGSTVEVKDVELHLKMKWNMWIPGYGTDDVKPYKRSTITEAHKKRLELKRKAIDKY